MGADHGSSSPLHLGSLGATYGFTVAQAIREAADQIVDDKKNNHNLHNVVALVIGLDTPGGTVFGSQAVTDAINYFREKTDLPVYSDVVGMAASGGYWIAAATDTISAHLGTMVGSVGVISGPFRTYNGTIAIDD